MYILEKDKYKYISEEGISEKETIQFAEKGTCRLQEFAKSTKTYSCLHF